MVFPAGQLPGKLMSLFLEWMISQDKSVAEWVQSMAPARDCQELSSIVFDYQGPPGLGAEQKEGGTEDTPQHLSLSLYIAKVWQQLQNFKWQYKDEDMAFKE